jgi:hypothetical protein
MLADPCASLRSAERAGRPFPHKHGFYISYATRYIPS